MIKKDLMFPFYVSSSSYLGYCPIGKAFVCDGFLVAGENGIQE